MKIIKPFLKFILFILMVPVVVTVIVLLLIFVPYTVAHTLALTGYCVDYNSFYSSQIKIDAAITRVDRNSTVALDGTGKDWPRVHYQTNEEFHQENPDCCSIYPSGTWEEFASNWFGVPPSAVVINYKAKYKTDSGEILFVKKQAFTSVDACGYVDGMYESTVEEKP